MNKKIVTFAAGIFLLGSILFLGFWEPSKKQEKNKTTETLKMSALVLENKEDSITVQDKDNIIYTFHLKNPSFHIGDYLVIEYSGILDKNKSVQEDTTIQNVALTTPVMSNEIPSEWIDEGIFKNYYASAYKKLQKLSLDEKIGQLFLVRYQESDALTLLNQYHFGGYVFFEKDFKDKTSDEVKTMIHQLQKNATVPLLTSVDEEGGKVVRISSNPKLVNEPFKSSQELYKQGGFDLIKEDTILKSQVLSHLGLNVNLAPVVDVTTDANAYMYPRTLGKDTKLTSTYAKTVIEASKSGNVSYTLKHFPGYGNNADTHTASASDTRSYADILANDLPPFEAGIKAGAEAVLVSHNIVSSIDSVPASLSTSVHNILRNHLDFTGIIITDDISMGATSNIDNVAVKALLAGNDLIITTDYKESIASIKKALQNNTVSEELINRVVLKNLAWKYYKGLLTDEK